MHDFEYVDEDNIEDVLNKADEEINTDIEEDQDKDSIIGIQAFHVELIMLIFLILFILELWICKIGLLKGRE